MALFANYTADRDATVQAYARATIGGAEACGCALCRNFIAARTQTFPAQFLAFLDDVGVDPSKEAEVFHAAPTGPGVHMYSGWFHFVGGVSSAENKAQLGASFSAWLAPATAPRLSALGGLPVVEVVFQADAVPWLLPEPEPT